MYHIGAARDQARQMGLPKRILCTSRIWIVSHSSGHAKDLQSPEVAGSKRQRGGPSLARKAVPWTRFRFECLLQLVCNYNWRFPRHRIRCQSARVAKTIWQRGWELRTLHRRNLQENQVLRYEQKRVFRVDINGWRPQIPQLHRRWQKNLRLRRWRPRRQKQTLARILRVVRQVSSVETCETIGVRPEVKVYVLPFQRRQKFEHPRRPEQNLFRRHWKL